MELTERLACLLFQKSSERSSGAEHDCHSVPITASCLTGCDSCDFQRTELGFDDQSGNKQVAFAPIILCISMPIAHVFPRVLLGSEVMISILCPLFDGNGVCLQSLDGWDPSTVLGSSYDVRATIMPSSGIDESGPRAASR